MAAAIGLFMGFWMHRIRPGRVVETSLIGVALLLLAIVGGSWIQNSSLASTLTLSPTTLVLCLVGYGCVASVLPVWLLLAPAPTSPPLSAEGAGEELVGVHS